MFKVLHQHDQLETLIDELYTLLYPWVVQLQSVVLSEVKEQQILEVERVEALRVEVVTWVAQKLCQLVFPRDLPGERHQSAEVMKRRLEELRRVSQDGDVGGVCGQQLGHLLCVEAHVIADNIEAHSGPVVFNLGALEQRGVEEVIPAVGEGEFEPVLLSEAEKDVEEGAAGRLVSLHEHDIHFRSAGLTSSLL